MEKKKSPKCNVHNLLFYKSLDLREWARFSLIFKVQLKDTRIAFLIHMQTVSEITVMYDNLLAKIYSFQCLF